MEGETAVLLLFLQIVAKRINRSSLFVMSVLPLLLYWFGFENPKLFVATGRNRLDIWCPRN